MWPVAFNFLLALLIFAFNIVVLVAVCGERRLHTPTRLLATNLWLANCISAVVTIFFALNPPPLLSSHVLSHSLSPCSSSSQSSTHSPPRAHHHVHILHNSNALILPKIEQIVDSAWPMMREKGAEKEKRMAVEGGTGEMSDGLSPLAGTTRNAHSSAVLLNSSVSLISLLAIGIVHALSTHGYRLSKSQTSRVLTSTWCLALLLLFADFGLGQLARVSSATSAASHLALPFHLALLSVFLFLNLLLHPTNLILLSRCSPTMRRSHRQEPERVRLLEESTTSSLWLLLNALSFVIIAMMAVWDARNGRDSSEHALGIEMAAYSVHCVANPLIAIIRDRPLELAIARLLRTTKRQPVTEDDLVIALMRDPPPPYSI